METCCLEQHADISLRCQNARTDPLQPSHISCSSKTSFLPHSEVNNSLKHTALLLPHCVMALVEQPEDFIYAIITHFDQ